MSVVLPRWIEQNMLREQMVDDQLEAVPYWNRLLRDIDDRLSLVWVTEQANAPGLVPGRWHVRRRNDDRGARDSYKPITTPDGGFRPMASDILEELRRQDMWRGDVAEGIFQEQVRREAAAEKANEEFLAGQREDLALNIKAKVAPSTLVNTDIPWSNTARGRRGRKKD